MARVKVPAYAVVGATQTIYTIDGKVLTGVGVAIPLADLADYARGSIIRGGAADWEAYDAKTSGAILVGDGTDLVSTVNPTLTGTLTLPNAGLHLLDTNASHDLIITPGSDLTADRTLTLTTGDAARTLTLGANVALDQNLQIADSPTFADVFVPDGGTFGIAGNELLTANAAGAMVFSGCNVGIGGTPTELLHGMTEANIGVAFRNASNNVGQRPIIVGERSRGTLAVPLQVVDDDYIYSLLAKAYIDGAYRAVASIDFLMDGVPSATSYPTRIAFLTTPIGGVGRREVARFDEDGDFGLGENDPDYRCDIQLRTTADALRIQRHTAGGRAQMILADENENELWRFGCTAGGGTTYVFWDGTSNVIAMTRTTGNVGLGTTTFGTNAATVLAIANGTQPTTSPANMIQLFSMDIAGGVASLGIRTEETVTAGAPTPSHKVKIKWNGTEYWLSLDAV